jgi:hypothetical protein
MPPATSTPVDAPDPVIEQPPDGRRRGCGRRLPGLEHGDLMVMPMFAATSPEPVQHRGSTSTRQGMDAIDAIHRK